MKVGDGNINEQGLKMEIIAYRKYKDKTPSELYDAINSWEVDIND